MACVQIPHGGDQAPAAAQFKMDTANIGDALYDLHKFLPSSHQSPHGLVGRCSDIQALALCYDNAVDAVDLRRAAALYVLQHGRVVERGGAANLLDTCDRVKERLSLIHISEPTRL